uniref:Neuropeptide-like GPCR n=1 Tax=Tripedalia cystophora TaxID=6141 RepID=A0A481ZNB9_TRICY|nr:neuropeptide-like GPCR [Tripedalia cystophora]
MISANVSCYAKEFQLNSPEALRVSLQWSNAIAVESFALMFFITGVIFNSMVIGSFVNCRRPLDVFEALVINLAVGDILASFIFPLPIAVQLLQGGQQIYDGGCKLLAWLGVVSLSVTSITLIAMAYCLNSRTRSRLLPSYHETVFWLGLFLLWVIPAFEGLPYLATVDWQDRDCTPSWSQSAQATYVAAMLLLQTVLPLALLTKMTVTTSIENYRQQFAAEQQLDSMAAPCILEENEERSVNRKNLRMLYILSASFFTILITYTFFHLWLALTIDVLFAEPTMAQTYVAFHLLLCFKPLLFPLIYFATWDSLRSNILEMTTRLCLKRRYGFREVKYTVASRSNGHSVGRTEDDGAVTIGGEMPVIEEIHGVEDTGRELSMKSLSEDRGINRYSSDYDVELEDVYRDDVAIL